MPGRHRVPNLLRRSGARAPLLVALVAVLATTGALAVANLAGAGGCSQRDGIQLEVAADPAIAPAVREAAEHWTASTEPQIDRSCVSVTVTAAPSAEVAAALGEAAGGFLDVASAAPEPGDPPTVWIPDSSYWVAQLRSVSRALFADDPVSLATSPVMLAASPAAAELFESPVDPADLREPVLAALGEQQPPPVRLAEPRRDTAGLVGAGWLQQAVVTEEAELSNVVAGFRALGDAPADTATLLAALDRPTDPDDPDDPRPLHLAVVSEQAATAHQRGADGTPATLLAVTDAPALDFPYAVLSNAPQHARTAAGMLRDALADAGETFAQHGFQPADPAVPAVSPTEQVRQTLRIWTSATRDARVLSVVNVNASMAEPMGPPGTPGEAVSRLEVFQAAASQGLTLFTPDSQLGHWEYASDHVEGAPIETLTEEHQEEILSAIQSIQLESSSDSAMFDTLLAGYREIKDGYQPGISNTLIVWTDRGDNQRAQLTLEDTLQELERLADVTRPIRVILLGIGPDADMDQLEAIAEATGGGAFHVEDPSEIGVIFLRALLT